MDVWTMVVLGDYGRDYLSTTVADSEEKLIEALRENYDPEGDLDDKRVNVVQHFEGYYGLRIHIENHEVR